MRTLLLDEPLTRERQEWKRVLTREAGEELERELTLRFGEGIRSRITTIYFDREDLALARRLAARDGCASRIRLRHYENPDAPVALPILALERKYQRFGLTRKVRVGVHAGEIASLLADRDRTRKVGFHRFGSLAPCCVVAYVRRAWMVEGMRITLDRELGCAAPSPGVLARLASGPLQVPPRPAAPAIFECKFAGAPPAWLPPADPIPFSKLTWALAQIGG